MKKILNSYTYILALFIIFQSCGTRKEIVYFQFDEVDQNKVNNDYQLRFRPDDLLEILISSDDLKAAQPFNLPVVNTFQIGGVEAGGQAQLMPYLVDSNGMIDFPVLGPIKIGGLTRTEAILRLKHLLSPKFLKNPVININIKNFKVTVQGDVANPGTFSVPNERLSILDAIGLAGDLNISGKRDNILVIREENGNKNQYRVDLTSNSIFTSPVYYLKQNDVIYVEPNKAKIQDSAYTRNTGLFISLAAVLVSLISIFTR